MTRDTKLSLLAGVLFVVGCFLAGLIISSGVLAMFNLPDADTMLALALLALVPTTLGLMRWLYLLEQA